MRVYVDSDMMMSQRVIRSLDHHMYPAAQVTKRINKISLKIFLVSVRGWCSEHNIASCAGERMVCACDWSMSLYMWLHCTGETCADPCPSSSWGDSYVEECRCDTGMERSVTMWLETVIPADQCHSEGTRYMWIEDVSVKETKLVWSPLWAVLSIPLELDWCGGETVIVSDTGGWNSKSVYYRRRLSVIRKDPQNRWRINN